MSRSLDLENGYFWSKYYYSLKEVLFYRLSRIALLELGTATDFYIAFAGIDRLQFIYYGRCYYDFELLTDKINLYYAKTNALKLRIYHRIINTDYSLGEKIKIAMEESARIKGQDLYEILKQINFPKEALFAYFARNRVTKQITYNKKVYRIKKVLKYLHETQNILDPNFYKKSNLMHKISEFDMPLENNRRDLIFNERTILYLCKIITNKFGINHIFYIVYLDKKCTIPLGVALDRNSTGFYHRRIRGLYYRETTPLRYVFYLECQELSYDSLHNRLLIYDAVLSVLLGRNVKIPSKRLIELDAKDEYYLRPVKFTNILKYND